MPISSACVCMSSRPNAVTIRIFGDVFQEVCRARMMAARLQAIHARHLPVHQDHAIGILRVGGNHFPDRLLAGRNRFGPKAKIRAAHRTESRGPVRCHPPPVRAAHQIRDETLALGLARPDAKPRGEYGKCCPRRIRSQPRSRRPSSPPAAWRSKARARCRRTSAWWKCRPG